MPFYEKAMENTPLAVSVVILAAVVLLGVLISVGGL
jgi:hypothetical protein